MKLTEFIKFKLTPFLKKQKLLFIFIFLGFFLLIFAALFLYKDKDKDKNSQNKSSKPLIATKDLTCDQIFENLILEHGEDYDSCLTGKFENKVCEKPSNLKDDFKENLNIELILDSSGSMAQILSGETKMAVAKEVLVDFLKVLPERANVGLRVYGHKGSNQEVDKQASCNQTELVYSLQKPDKFKFSEAINSFSPTGWTPIAGSLKAAGEDFSQFPAENSSNIVYLVSDGIETCDGDPIAVARSLKEQNINVTVNIVGFAVDSQARNQLKQVAQATGGEYFDAKTTSEMRQVFENYQKTWKEWTKYYYCSFNLMVDKSIDSLNYAIKAKTCINNKILNESSKLTKAIVKLLNNKEIDSSCYSTLLDKKAERLNKIRTEKMDQIDKQKELQQQDARKDFEEASEERKENIQK